MEKFETLKQTILGADADVAKFEAGNNAAGTRVRGVLQEIKKLAQELRTEIQNTKNSKKKGE